jgi:GntR family transcriptional regulator
MPIWLVMLSYVIDPRGDVPVYRQVAAVLRDRINDGTYPEGDELPPIASLASEFGVGRDAVQDALAVLRGEGLVETRRGFRTRVRELGIRTPIAAGPGSVVYARMPTPEERTRHDMGEGVPVLVVGDEVYPSDRFEIHFTEHGR